MSNLLRMDLYRMRKGKSFWICLLLAFLCSFSQTPIEKLFFVLSRFLSAVENQFPKTANLSTIIGDPMPLLNAMLIMISVTGFFYADIENGFVKNIAGQMPRRGFTVLSRFLAVIPHNLLFMLAGVGGNLIGTAIFRRIIVDEEVTRSVVTFLVKFLLIQSICAILVLVVTSLRSKSLGSVLFVLFGTRALSLVYMAIDTGIYQLLKVKNFTLASYMPDQLMFDSQPKVLTSILSAGVTTAIFLSLAIRIFDRRDVK